MWSLVLLAAMAPQADRLTVVHLETLRATHCRLAGGCDYIAVPSLAVPVGESRGSTWAIAVRPIVTSGRTVALTPGRKAAVEVRATSQRLALIELVGVTQIYDGWSIGEPIEVLQPLWCGNRTVQAITPRKLDAAFPPNVIGGPVGLRLSGLQGVVLDVDGRLPPRDELEAIYAAIPGDLVPLPDPISTPRESIIPSPPTAQQPDPLVPLPMAPIAEPSPAARSELPSRTDAVDRLSGHLDRLAGVIGLGVELAPLLGVTVATGGVGGIALAAWGVFSALRRSRRGAPSVPPTPLQATRTHTITVDTPPTEPLVVTQTQFHAVESQRHAEAFAYAVRECVRKYPASEQTCQVLQSLIGQYLAAPTRTER